METEWKTLKLCECASFQEGYVNPSQKYSEFFDGDIKWLRAIDLNDSYVWNTTRTLTEAGFKSAGKSALLFKPDTLAISKSGTIGRIGILKDYMCGNRAVINIEVDNQICDQSFIFYILKQHRPLIENLAIGSVQKNLYTSALGTLEFKCPKLSSQRKIGSLLRALDDKIELNRQISQTLESMAQALFKSWFVDFDPVIDNALAAGNETPEPFTQRAAARQALREQASAGDSSHPALPDDIRRLFPSSFQLTEKLGWIPEGWSVATLVQLCEKVQNGGTPRKNTPEYWTNGDIPWLTSGEVRKPIVLDTKNRITKIGLEKSSAKWLPPGSTVVAMYGATAGQVAFIGSELTTNQAICGLIPKSGYRIFNFLQLTLSVNYLENQARGSAQQNISKGIIENVLAINPGESLANAFETVMSPLFEKWMQNIKQNSVLSKLRDSLLPKLLSGELRIPDAEKFAAEAGL